MSQSPYSLGFDDNLRLLNLGGGREDGKYQSLNQPEDSIHMKSLTIGSAVSFKVSGTKLAVSGIE